MPTPSNNATATSVNGTLLPTVITFNPNDNECRVVIDGASPVGVTGTIDVSVDGTTYYNIEAIQENTSAPVNGTLSPGSSKLSYWFRCAGWNYGRWNSTAVASGTSIATLYAAPSIGGVPIGVTSNSSTSFTSATFSGTVGVTGLTTLTGGAATGAKIYPSSDDGAPLGDTTHNFSDLFLATGAVINYQAGNVVLTHTSGVLTLGTGNLIITTAGTAAGSVATISGTQTLTNKTLTSPVIGTGLTASGSTANDFSGSTGTFKTSTGTVTLGGNTLFKIIATPVAATGAGGGVSGAAALGAGNFLTVSSDGATKGVKLLTGVAGDVKWILNTSSTACDLFAASGGTINGGSADAGCAIPASKGVLAVCTAADTWTVFDMPAHAGAAA